MNWGDKRYWLSHGIVVEIRAKLVTEDGVDDFYIVISDDGEYHVVPDYDLSSNNVEEGESEC